MEDLISVVVPVYNSQKYLEECLNSIINQEYKNLEILLVNDGSTDNSPKICKAFAEKDSRIKFFSKENGGQASARNYALDRMTGSYVTFVDNDDWVRPQYCSNLYKAAIEHDADIAGCEEFFNPFEKLKSWWGYRLYTMQEYAELLMPDVIISHVISKLFKAEIFNSNKKVRFPENLRSVEDMGIFPHILRKSKKIVMTDLSLYFYRRHSGNTSIITSKIPVAAMERALIFIERYSMAADWVPDTMPVLLKKAVWFSVSSYTWFNKENAEKYSDGYERIREFLINHQQGIKNSTLIDSARKIAAKFIISNRTWPFRMISPLRPAMKKIVNALQGKEEN